MTGIMSVYISMICIYIQEWPTVGKNKFTKS